MNGVRGIFRGHHDTKYREARILDYHPCPILYGTIGRTSLVWLGSCTVRAHPRLREGVRVLISMLTLGSAWFSQGYA